MPGFKASAFQTQMGCMLAIDNVFKFLCTTSCLQKIRELKERSHSDHQYQQMVKMEFSRKSVIGNWGNKRTYIVHDVEFDKSVIDHKFSYNGNEITIAEYFQQVYKLRVTDIRQPLFVIKMSNDYLYLPPEFTILDGVPDHVRKGPGMREALMQTKLTPQDRMTNIQSMFDTLKGQKSI